MTNRFRIPILLALLLAAIFPSHAGPASTNPRLAEILCLPELKPADWEDLFALAEDGDAEAQYVVGGLYSMGDRIPHDEEKAVFWFRKAAAQGEPRAANWLCGREAKMDQMKSNRCLLQAAEDGVPEAEFWLGMAFRDHLWDFGITDEQTALKWFRKAAESGDPDGQVEIGRRYEEGNGVEQDYIQAAYWYRRAAEHVPDLGGAGQGRIKLGLLYLEGKGVPKDVVQACMWFLFARSGFNIETAKRHVPPEQIAQAQVLATEWRKQHPRPVLYWAKPSPSR